MMERSVDSYIATSCAAGRLSLMHDRNVSVHAFLAGTENHETSNVPAAPLESDGAATQRSLPPQIPAVFSSKATPIVLNKAVFEGDESASFPKTSLASRLAEGEKNQVAQRDLILAQERVLMEFYDQDIQEAEEYGYGSDKLSGKVDNASTTDPAANSNRSTSCSAVPVSRLHMDNFAAAAFLAREESPEMPAAPLAADGTSTQRGLPPLPLSEPSVIAIPNRPNNAVSEGHENNSPLISLRQSEGENQVPVAHRELTHDQERALMECHSCDARKAEEKGDDSHLLSGKSAYADDAAERETQSATSITVRTVLPIFLDSKKKLSLQSHDIEHVFLPLFRRQHEHKLEKGRWDGLRVVTITSSITSSFEISVSGFKETVELILRGLENWIRNKMSVHNFGIVQLKGSVVSVDLDPSLTFGANLTAVTVNGEPHGLFIKITKPTEQLALAVGYSYTTSRCAIIDRINGAFCRSIKKFKLLKQAQASKGGKLRLQLKFLRRASDTEFLCNYVPQLCEYTVVSIGAVANSSNDDTSRQFCIEHKTGREATPLTANNSTLAPDRILEQSIAKRNVSHKMVASHRDSPSNKRCKMSGTSVVESLPDRHSTPVECSSVRASANSEARIPDNQFGENAANIEETCFDGEATFGGDAGFRGNGGSIDTFSSVYDLHATAQVEEGTKGTDCLSACDAEATQRDTSTADEQQIQNVEDQRLSKELTRFAATVEHRLFANGSKPFKFLFVSSAQFHQNEPTAINRQEDGIVEDEADFFARVVEDWSCRELLHYLQSGGLVNARSPQILDRMRTDIKHRLHEFSIRSDLGPDMEELAKLYWDLTMKNKVLKIYTCTFHVVNAAKSSLQAKREEARSRLKILMEWIPKFQADTKDWKKCFDENLGWNGLNIKISLLHAAVWLEEPGIVAMLLRAGNYPFSISSKDVSLAKYMSDCSVTVKEISSEQSTVAAKNGSSGVQLKKKFVTTTPKPTTTK